MVNTPDDNELTPLERRSRALFDDGVANLDAHTRSRLNQARQAALQVAEHRKHGFAMRWLVPTGSVAALALVVMVSMQFMRGPTAPNVQTSSGMEDMELVASADELELLQNDVEFYDWFDSPDAEATSGEAS